MTTLVVQVTHGLDDAYYSNLDGFDPTHWYMSVGSSDSRRTWMRFQAVTIPQGATIQSAVLDVRAAIGDSGSLTVGVAGNDVDNAARLTTYAAANGAAKTTAVSWSMPDFTANSTYNSPSIASVVSAVVNRSSWASGNALALFLTPTSGTAQRRLATYDEGFLTPPRLTVDYTAGGPTEQHSSGGASASVATAAVGAGTKTEQQASSGGASASVTVTVAGSGSATEVASAGAVASVIAEAAGDGVGVEPFALTVTADGPDVDLSWNAQPAATGYAIERDGALVAWDVQGETWTDVDPGAGEHTYRVGAIL